MAILKCCVLTNMLIQHVVRLFSSVGPIFDVSPIDLLLLLLCTQFWYYLSAHYFPFCQIKLHFVLNTIVYAKISPIYSLI